MKTKMNRDLAFPPPLGAGGIVIIDYGAGNIQSINFALNRLGCKAVLTNDATKIKNADRVIFPGVGEASSAMEMLRANGLHKIIPELKQPVLGICLGMQLLCKYSEEGNTTGMNVFDIEVKRFPNLEKVPQVGWNQINSLKSRLFKNISEKEFMYLVHSYYVPLCEYTIATTDYGINYSSALKKNNFYGVQFHPEKSSTAGEVILRNFLML